jgi:hypothetical protein
MYTIFTVLAVQNMDASDMVSKGQEIEFNALEGSLTMMSKGASFPDYHRKHAHTKYPPLVLNDVLDLCVSCHTPSDLV